MSLGTNIKGIYQGTGLVTITIGTVAKVEVDVTAHSISSVNKCEVQAWVADPSKWTAGGTDKDGFSSIAPHLSSTIQLDLYIAGGGSTITRYTWQITEYY